MSTPRTERETPRVRVGISSCLLGAEVRYDGGHKHDSDITHVLGQHFEWVLICPEVEIGLGVPRETIRLEGAVDAPRLIASESRTDHTETMLAFAEAKVAELKSTRLCGYLFKKNSPSCGMERVRVYKAPGRVSRKGRGLFANAVLEAFPLLPTEEEGRLSDSMLRENFIKRVYAYHHLRTFLDGNPTPRDLVAFHQQHKLTPMPHHNERYRELGRLAAQAGAGDFPTLLETYAILFMETLRYRATAR